MVKFRTMVEGADRLDAARGGNEAEGALFDPRRPARDRVGALLRRLSLDELPQVLNVLAAR